MGVPVGFLINHLWDTSAGQISSVLGRPSLLFFSPAPTSPGDDQLGSQSVDAGVLGSLS